MWDYSYYPPKRLPCPFKSKAAKVVTLLFILTELFLSKTTFPFEVGDELISFNNQPTKKVVDGLMKELGPNTLETQHAIASRFLTRRLGRILYEVPQGPVVLEIRRKGSQQTQIFQTVWHYKQNTVDYSSIDKLHSNSYTTEEHPLSHAKNFMMTPHLFHTFSQELSENKLQDKDMNPYILGSPVSFIPPLSENIIYKQKSLK